MKYEKDKDVFPDFEKEHEKGLKRVEKETGKEFRDLLEKYLKDWFPPITDEKEKK